MKYFTFVAMLLAATSSTSSAWSAGTATTPEQGCCMDKKGVVTIFNRTYALQLDEGYKLIPEDAKACESEWYGYQAMGDGQGVQSSSVRCSGATYTSFGSTSHGNYFIVKQNNGTVTCQKITPKLSATSFAMRDEGLSCFGKKGSHQPNYAGPVFYGGMKAARYSNDDESRVVGYVDVDVDGGCIPITMVGGMYMHMTNFKQLTQVPPNLFDLPAACAKAVGSMMV